MKTSTKWIIAISWIVLIFVVVVVFQNLGHKSADAARQYNLETAGYYEAQASNEYALFAEKQGMAKGLLREWMSTDQRVDYDRYSALAMYHWDRYNEYKKLAEQYRGMAQSK